MVRKLYFLSTSDGKTKPSVKYGIGGIRGIVNRFPITNQSMFHIGQAIGLMMKQLFNKDYEGILILSDTRASCPKLRESLSLGLGSQKVKILDAGVLPTAAAKHLLNSFYSASFALVISASHNKYTYNGLKIFSRQGSLSPKEQRLLNKNLAKLYHSSNQTTQPVIINVEKQAKSIYVKKICSIFAKYDFSKLPIIAVDYANGSAYQVGPEIFKTLGIKTIDLGITPSGKNINLKCGSTYMQNVINAVKNSDAAIGIALDGDADRSLFCNKAGKIKDGDDILALLSQFNEFKKNKKIIGTLISNSALEMWLKERGQLLIRGDLGEANVIATMKKEQSTLGAEPSGHVLLGKTPYGSDGILTSLHLLQSILDTDNLTIQTFDKFFSHLFAINLTEKLNQRYNAIDNIIKHWQDRISPGRILVRHSQTEPVLRIYVESQNKNLGKKVVKSLQTEIENITKCNY